MSVHVLANMAPCCATVALDDTTTHGETQPNVDSILLENPEIWLASRWGRTVVKRTC